MLCFLSFLILWFASVDSGCLTWKEFNLVDDEFPYLQDIRPVNNLYKVQHSSPLYPDQRMYIDDPSPLFLFPNWTSPDQTRKSWWQSYSEEVSFVPRQHKIFFFFFFEVKCSIDGENWHTLSRNVPCQPDALGLYSKETFFSSLHCQTICLVKFFLIHEKVSLFAQRNDLLRFVCC